MKNNILIYSLNSAPETTGVGRYVGQMSEYLSNLNKYNVTILTAAPYYPQWKIYAGHQNRYHTETSPNLRVIRCPLYVPQRSGTARRIIHLLSFALTSLPALIKLIPKKHLCIIVIAPTLTIVPSALLFAKITKAKSMLHIQDFELEAMLGINLNGNKNKVYSYGIYIERFLMSKFDVVSTISNRMISTLHSKGVHPEKTVFFPNWVDTNSFKPIEDKKECRKKIGIDFEGKLVLYSGNMGKKQGLGLILEAANMMQMNKSVLFIIAGDGSERRQLEEKAASLSLDNVRFIDFVSEENLPFLLNSADIHLVLQKTGVGDSVMPSKLSNIIAVGGHVIVSAEENTEIFDIDKLYPGIFNLIPTDNLSTLVQTIENLCMNNNMSTNKIGMNYAQTNLDHNEILAKYENCIEQLVK